MFDYLQNIQKLFREYDKTFFKPFNLYWLNDKDLIFIYKEIKYQLHENDNCISLWKILENDKMENLHNVPIMLSCTDIFMFSHIKTNILIKKGQLTIFDFLEGNYE